MPQTLRDDKLPKKLAASNIARFSVEWTGKEGIDEESHKAYFQAFCEKFYGDVTKQIDDAMAKHVKLANDPVYNEPLQHLHACRNHVSAFQVSQSPDLKTPVLGYRGVTALALLLPPTVIFRCRFLSRLVTRKRLS